MPHSALFCARFQFFQFQFQYIYLPSCLSQETAKWPYSLQVKLPPVTCLELKVKSPHYPVNAERQAGKLWIPILKSLVWPDQESNLYLPAFEADALTTRPSRR